MRSPKPALAVAQLILAMALAACGGTSTQPPPPAPRFTSSPTTSATESVSYAYSLAATDPAGGTISFALTDAPTGAILSANTLSWTPTHNQSRTANNFSVTATSTSGGSGTQTWTVTPAGTILISWTDTYWTAVGSTPAANQLSIPGYPRAVVTESDGSSLIRAGSMLSPGNFAIPAVPAGYFLLALTPATNFVTSSSAFDFGRDIVGHQLTALPASVNTTIEITGTGLDPLPASGLLAAETDTSNLPFPLSTTPTIGLTTASVGGILDSNIDFSTVETIFLGQYVSGTTGDLPSLALDLAATDSTPMLMSGQANDISQMLTPSPRTTLEVDIKGSQWAALAQNTSPAVATPVSSAFFVSAQPFVTDRFALPLNSGLGPDLALLAPFPTLPFINPSSSSCGDVSGSTSSINPLGQPPILTDRDFGTVTYGDPLPAAWPRFESYCQRTTTQVTFPGSPTPVTVQLDFGAITAVSSAPIVPLVGAPLNPTINGANFFTAATISTQSPTIAWSAPVGFAPTAYIVSILNQLTAPDGTVFTGRSSQYSTTKNSVTVLPLTPGQTYLFLITAKLDGHANVETNPNRSQLPVAFASTLSAPITINSAP
jgi:hypothetical protein